MMYCLAVNRNLIKLYYVGYSVTVKLTIYLKLIKKIEITILLQIQRVPDELLLEAIFFVFY